MGASGVQLFDDDIAADVRDIYVELLRRGQENPTAAASVMEEFRDLIGTEDESVLWLALAAVQWKYGLLQPEILNRALRVIEDGSDLHRWTFNAANLNQHREVLAALADRLKSTNLSPRTVRLRKTLPPRCDWQLGEVVAYRLTDGRFILLRIVTVDRGRFDDRVVCELLDWISRDLPTMDVVVSLPVRLNCRYASESLFHFPMTRKHLARCRAMNAQVPAALRDDGSCHLSVDFNNLAAELHEHFGLPESGNPEARMG